MLQVGTGEKREPWSLPWSLPQIWRQLIDHSSNCYFYMVDPTKRRTGKNAPQIVYPDIPSSIAPVPHCPELPILTPPKRDQPSSGDISKSDSEEDLGDPDHGFTDVVEERRPYFPNQKPERHQRSDQRPWSYWAELLTSNAKLLTSRLKQWNLLDENVQVTDQRKRY